MKNQKDTKSYKPVPSYVIANYFIDKSLEDWVYVDILKLIKLVYISHGWRLALENIPLIKDKIEAWKYGPSIPYMYRLFLKSKNKSDERIIYKIEPLFNFIKYQIQTDLLDDVWRVYGDFSSIQLANICNDENSAYNVIKREVDLNKIYIGPEIHNDIIRKHYMELLKRG